MTVYYQKDLTPSGIDDVDVAIIHSQDNMKKLEVYKKREDWKVKKDVHPGSFVRILNRRTKLGHPSMKKKSKQDVWSSEVYKVLKFHGVNTLHLEVPDDQGEDFIPEIWPIWAVKPYRGRVGAPKKARKRGPVINRATIVEQKKRAGGTSYQKGSDALTIIEAAMKKSGRPQRKRVKQTVPAKFR